MNTMLSIFHHKYIKSILLLITVCIAISSSSGQTLSSEEVLSKSIQYHDPNNQWPVFKGELRFDQISPTRIQQTTRTVTMDRSIDLFRFEQQSDDVHIMREINQGVCRNLINGNENYSKEMAEQYRMTCDRASMYKDYYSYLYGLPMKMRDPGTLMDPIANEDNFQGKPCYSIRVLYEAGVGDDTWDFFFDKDSYALIGYRFFHDVSKNDGEYITLHGEETIGGIKMPKNRFWYMNQDGRYLGADLLLPEPSKEIRDLSEDYDRAIQFQWGNIINKKVFREQITPHWFPDSTGLWYNRYDAQGKWYHRINFNTLEDQPLFDHEVVADKLSEIMEDTLEYNKLPINNLTYVSTDTFTFQVKGKRYQLSLNDHSIVSIESKGNNDPYSSTSPDGKWTAFSKDYNLHIKNNELDTVIKVSDDGSEHFQYGSYYGWFDLMEGENGERPKRFYVDWSPDSKYLLINICDTRTAEKMYMLDWSIDTLFKPRLLSYFRGSPGDTTMVHYQSIIYSLEDQSLIEQDLPRTTHINSPGFTWSEKEGILYMQLPQRGYKQEDVVQFNLRDGSRKSIISESSETNIDDMRVWYQEGAGKIFFTSQKSGWRQLYAYDLVSEKTLSVTDGSFFIHNVLRMDDKERVIYFTAAGKEEGANPYQEQLYSVSYEGGAMTRLTSENLHHSISISPDGKYFWDNASTVSYPTRVWLKKVVDGSIVNTISHASVDQMYDEGWRPPMTFQAIGRDGETTIYGALWKPTHFDPSKKYPLIDHTYTGPHTQMFPASFRSSISRNNQALAELGFIVMMVDGMGTYGRSKEFHNVSYKNMGMNLLDHKLAIQQLGERYEWIDTSRVGIFGHSAGGYDAAHAMLQFPETYDVAVSSSADHDFRMEKAWWPEMYMGWPVDSLYHEVSNITMADRLEGKLLLVHGALDDNVNASATFKLAEALVDADKEFDLLILPSQRHGYSDLQHRRYFTKKRWNYFIKHLLGKDPPWKVKW